VQPTKADQTNAAQECRYERGNTHATQLAFLHWGTNANHRNAFGKCISATTREEAQEREDAHANAAKDCEAEQDMTDQEFMALHETVETFEQFYGTNDNLATRTASASPPRPRPTRRRWTRRTTSTPNRSSRPRRPVWRRAGRT